jgi:choline-glycine betaine transporter
VDILSPPVLGIIAPFTMVVLIVAFVMFRKVRENELRVHQELRTKEMEHERRMKELEIEKARLELEKARTEQKV